MAMPSPEHFEIGDCVQVLDHCFSAVLRGAIGRIAAAPAGLVACNSSWQTYWRPDPVGEDESACVYWVEFDYLLPGDDPVHFIDGAEISSTDLRRVSG
jgi:hypothetical protein